MLEEGVSMAAIRRITRRAQEIGLQSAYMFDVKNPEADVQQDHFDRPLRKIWGGEYSPFRERYEYMKEPKY